MNRENFIKLLVITLSVGWLYSAQAVVISCTDVAPPTTLSKVQYASACQKSTTATQDFLNTTPMTVNSEGFYGYTDWAFLYKNDPAGNGQTGTWTLTNNEWATYANIILIFKDGNGTTLLGFLMSPGYYSGSWNSPFTYDEFGANICGGNQTSCSTIKNVSHVSYYARGVAPPPPGGEDPPTIVTEPSPLLLMLLGVFGLLRVRSWKLAR